MGVRRGFMGRLGMFMALNISMRGCNAKILFNVFCKVVRKNVLVHRIVQLLFCCCSRSHSHALCCIRCDAF